MKRTAVLLMVGLTVAAVLWPQRSINAGGGAEARFFNTWEQEIYPLQAWEVVVFDFDRDGDLDFLSAPLAPGAATFDSTPIDQVEPAPLWAWRNEGEGLYTEVTDEVSAGTRLLNVGVALVEDFNGDGWTDVFLGEAGIDRYPFPGGQSQLLLGNPAGQLSNVTTTHLPEAIEFAHDLTAGDIDRDGDLDVFKVNIGCCLEDHGGLGPFFYINDGHGRFTATNTNFSAEIGIAAELVDVDRDGDPDLFLGATLLSDGLTRYQLLLNDGHGFFDLAPVELPPPPSPDYDTYRIHSADFDGDGWPDLLTSSYARETFDRHRTQLLMNDRQGSFRDATPDILTTSNQSDTQIGDLNGDGWPDLIQTLNPVEWRDGGVLALFHRGGEDFDFTSATEIFEQEGLSLPERIVVRPHIGDVDGDGDNDVFWPGIFAIFFSENLRPFLPAEALPVPARISLQGPEYDAVVQVPLDLVWEHTQRATSYQVEISADPDFHDVVWSRASYTGSSLPVAGLGLDRTFYWRVRGVNLSGPGRWSETSVFSTTSAPCSASPTHLCLNESRFRVEVEWRDFVGNAGAANVVPFGSADSGLFWFFDGDNWEMLVKVLDGCAFNDRFWVFAAATTDVEYVLRVTDELTGAVSEYFNSLGQASSAITDTDAFATCSEAGSQKSSGTILKPALIASAASDSRAPHTSSAESSTCTAQATGLCLNEGRFRVEADWKDFAGNTGTAQVVSAGSDDSGLFWFFGPDNWEMLVKVLNGCALNNHFWVFSAATTNVEYTLRVTDTQGGAVKEYFNPLGTSAPAITDTGAFAACP